MFRSLDRVRAAAARVRSLRDAGHTPVVVASARGDTTDRLLRDIGAVDPSSAGSTREADRVLATAGIDDSLLRLSVGIEHADDLCEDLTCALDASERRALSLAGG